MIDVSEVLKDADGPASAAEGTAAFWRTFRPPDLDLIA